MKGRSQELLEQLLVDVGAVAGTVHIREGQGLRLAAAVNIPDVGKKAVGWVPSGKGMAGLALEQGKPIKTCNLREDRTGNVRPGAREVGARAAVALPIRDGHNSIVAVIGVAFDDERAIDNGYLRDLEDKVRGIADELERVS